MNDHNAVGEASAAPGPAPKVKGGGPCIAKHTGLSLADL